MATTAFPEAAAEDVEDVVSGVARDDEPVAAMARKWLLVTCPFTADNLCVGVYPPHGVLIQPVLNQRVFGVRAAGSKLGTRYPRDDLLQGIPD